MSTCEHKHAHPFRCDDCGLPWCTVCAVYHADPAPFACGRRSRASLDEARKRVEELEAEVARLQQEQEQIHRGHLHDLQAANRHCAELEAEVARLRGELLRAAEEHFAEARAVMVEALEDEQT